MLSFYQKLKHSRSFAAFPESSLKKALRKNVSNNFGLFLETLLGRIFNSRSKRRSKA